MIHPLMAILFKTSTYFYCIKVRVNDTSATANPQYFFYNGYADMNQHDYGVMFAYKHDHFRLVKFHHV